MGAGCCAQASPRQGGASAGPRGQPSLPFPSSQEGRTSPSYTPAGSDLASAVARERGRRKQGRDCWGQSSRWKSQGQLCTALQEPRIQGGGSVRPRKMSRGHGEASRASELGWKGGEELPRWLAPASISWGLTTPSWAGAGGSPMPGGRVHNGAIREGGWWVGAGLRAPRRQG